jgi:uncharacterized membrane protein
MGGPVSEVSGDGTGPTGASRRLQGTVALGLERAVEQDAACSIRIMADVAVKALSVAINEPSAGGSSARPPKNVLRLPGPTPLRGRLPFSDRDGMLRLVTVGQTLGEYLTLAVSEIREYGSSSIQVMRRIWALLETYVGGASGNRPAVDAEIARLDATTCAGFAGPGTSIGHSSTA